MSQSHIANDSQIAVQVAHLIATYGPDAISIAQEHLYRFRANKDWYQEQQWQTIYNELLFLSDTLCSNY